MKGRIPLVLAALFCGLLLAAFAAPVPGPQQTVLTFQREPDFQVGDEIDFLVKLETLSGAPLEAQEIELSIDGEVFGSVETDALGAVLFRIEAHFLPGTYSVEAVYRGFQFYLPAKAAVDLTVAPAEILVQTVPVIAGLEFLLAGQVLRTGADGIARTSVDRAGAYTLELLPNEMLLSQTGAVFKQWGPGGFEPVTTVTVPGDVWKQAGFEISFPGNFIFVDPDGNPIDRAEIDSVVLRGSDGMVYIYTAGEALRLYANRIFARLSGLDSVAVVHSVQSVIVDGVEVVNRGQQRFVLVPDLPVEIELLFYDVRFVAEDLLFGLPAGSGLELVYPDGVARLFDFDDGGVILLTGLARGEYEARLVTNAGIAPAFPIVLSRDQEVRLPVIGFVDLAAGLITAAVLVLGLPIFGRRRQILAFLRGPRRVGGQQEQR